MSDEPTNVEVARLRRELVELRAEHEADRAATRRVLAVMDQGSLALAGSNTELELCQRYCEALVCGGEYRLAWVGLAEHDPECTVRPIAQAGFDEGYLSTLDVRWSRTERGDGPTGRAIRLGTPQTARDIHNDPKFAPWREAATERGYASSIALPLRVDDQMLGALNVYAQQPTAFDENELLLLMRMASDLSKGIDRFRVRDSANDAHQQLVAAVHQLSETVMISDRAGRLTYVNPAFERMSGFASSEVIGRKPNFLKSGRHDEGFYQGMWSKLQQGGIWNDRIVNCRKDGSIYTVEATMSPVRDQRGDVVSYVSVQRDITQQINLETQLRQAVKMEAIGRLAGGIAHDFNNLLTVIMTSCHFLAADLHDVDPMLQDVHSIQDAGTSAMALTRQLLAFSSKQTVRPAVLNINDTMTSMEKMLRRLIHEDVDLDLDLDASLGHIRADVSQIEQVVMNLAVNARDAMPQGGGMRIQTRNVTVEDQPFVLLTVQDTGMGMDAETKARIFEPFFTTKDVGQGTGLGLPTVYGIVARFGGFIEVESEVGAGCTFRLHFPRVAAEDTVAPVPRRASGSGRGERILLVEDDAVLRSLTRRLLESAHFSVLEASDSEHAQLLVEREDEQIDLLFTDVVMPKVNGMELAQRARVVRPELLVVFTTGYPDEVIAAQGVLASDISLVAKPYDADALVRVIRSVLDGLKPGGIGESPP